MLECLLCMLNKIITSTSLLVHTHRHAEQQSHQIKTIIINKCFYLCFFSVSFLFVFVSFSCLCNFTKINYNNNDLQQS